MTGGVRKIVIILIYSILIQVRHALNAYPGFCCQLYIKWIFAMSPRKTCILSLDCTDHSLVWPFLDNCHRNRCSTYSQTTHTFSSQQWFCVQCALLHLRVHFTMYFTYFFLRALVMITKSKALKFSLLLKIFLFFLFFFPPFHFRNWTSWPVIVIAHKIIFMSYCYCCCCCFYTLGRLTIINMLFERERDSIFFSLFIILSHIKVWA